MDVRRFPRMRRTGRQLAIAMTTIALAGCAGLPSLREERTRTAAHYVTLTDLPDGSRIAEELQDGKYRVLGVGVRERLHLAIPYEQHETVHNGVIESRTPRQVEVVLSVQAPGRRPRRIHVQVPGPDRIDAHLEMPSVVHVPNASPELDDVRVLFLEGRCEMANDRLPTLDANARAGLEPLRATCATRAARRVDDDGSRDWDPLSLGIPKELAESPRTAESALEGLTTKESDDAAGQGLVVMHALALTGRLNDAAELAALIATPLPAKRAALVLELPASILAIQRLRLAEDDLRNGDSRAALEHASDALAISPWTAARAYRRVREERVRALVASARLHESRSDSLVARAYWTAVAALDPKLPDGQQGLARTETVVLDRIRARVALRSTDAASERALEDALRSLLPRHVVTVAGEERADAAVLFAVSPVARTYRVSTTHRKKSVFAFRTTKPNPAFEEARQELASAEENLAVAREAYERLHAAAQDMVAKSKQGGVAGSFAASAAIAEESAAVAVLKSAEIRLRNARATVQKTPRTVAQDVHRDVDYPVLRFEADAIRSIALRLEGFGEAFDASRSAKASLVREQTVASPEIGVEGSPSPEGELKALAPDITSTIGELAASVRDHIVAYETAQAESAWTSARADGDPVRAASLAVIYLEVLPAGAGERIAVTRNLVESLP